MGTVADVGGGGNCTCTEGREVLPVLVLFFSMMLLLFTVFGLLGVRLASVITSPVDGGSETPLILW
jgi:hypothetical protein